MRLALCGGIQLSGICQYAYHNSRPSHGQLRLCYRNTNSVSHDAVARWTTRLVNDSLDTHLHQLNCFANCLWDWFIVSLLRLLYRRFLVSIMRPDGWLADEASDFSLNKQTFLAGYPFRRTTSTVGSEAGAIWGLPSLSTLLTLRGCWSQLSCCHHNLFRVRTGCYRDVSRTGRYPKSCGSLQHQQCSG